MNKTLSKKVIACVMTATLLCGFLPAKKVSAANIWKKDARGNYYLTTEYGKPVSGWQNFHGKIYYTAENGRMQTGWLHKDGNWYYLADDGSLQTGWILYNGEYYYSDSQGIMQTGLIMVDYKLYYLGNDGIMRRHSFIHNGEYITIGNNGAVQTESHKLVPSKVFVDGQEITGGNGPVTTPTNPMGNKYEKPVLDQSEIGDYGHPVRMFSVEFRDINGQLLETKSVKDGTTVPLTALESEDELKEFIGWNTKPDGSGRTYSEGESIKVGNDIVLYAMWNIKEEPVKVSGIFITGDDSVEVGREIQLRVDVKPGIADNQEILWTSSDPAIAEVDENGVVSGKAVGNVKIYAEAKDGSGVKAEIEIKVEEYVKLIQKIEIKAEGGKTEIKGDDERIQMTAQVDGKGSFEPKGSDFVWKITEGNGYAEISDDGIITPIADGKIAVRAFATDKSGVKSEPYYINITDQSIKVKEFQVVAEGNISDAGTGDKIKMSIQAIPGNAEIKTDKLKWEVTSGNADISQDGELTCREAGEVVVTATYNGKSRSKKITVHKNIEEKDIVITDSKGNTVTQANSIAITDEFASEIITASIDKNAGEYKKIEWTWEPKAGSDIKVSDIASVTQEGSKGVKIKAKKDGEFVLKLRVELFSSNPAGSVIEKEIPVIVTGQPVYASSINWEAKDGTFKEISRNEETRRGEITVSASTDKPFIIEAAVDDKANRDKGIEWKLIDSKNNIVLNGELKDDGKGNVDKKVIISDAKTQKYLGEYVLELKAKDAGECTYRIKINFTKESHEITVNTPEHINSGNEILLSAKVVASDNSEIANADLTWEFDDTKNADKDKVNISGVIGSGQKVKITLKDNNVPAELHFKIKSKDIFGITREKEFTINVHPSVNSSDCLGIKVGNEAASKDEVVCDAGKTIDFNASIVPESACISKGPDQYVTWSVFLPSGAAGMASINKDTGEFKAADNVKKEIEVRVRMTYTENPQYYTERTVRIVPVTAAP